MKLSENILEKSHINQKLNNLALVQIIIFGKISYNLKANPVFMKFGETIQEKNLVQITSWPKFYETWWKYI